MGNIGMPELLVIFVIALIFLANPCGPDAFSVAAKSERFCAIWLILPAR